MVIECLFWTVGGLLYEPPLKSSMLQVINHGSLPKNPLLYHVPHNSFDSQGVLRKEAFDVRKDNEKLSSADVASVVLPIKGDSLIHHPRNEDRNRNLVEVFAAYN